MLQKALTVLSALSRSQISILSILLIGIVGGLDYLTGYEISFSIFYLIPVGLAAWYLNKPLAIVACVLSGATWLGVELAFGRPYSHPAIPIWNAIVRLGFFAIVASLLVRVRLGHTLLASLARVDGLTGLLNARTFKETGAYFFELGTRQRRSLAIGFIDLDGFKLMNDNFGHSAGDLALKAVAEVLESRQRRSDIAARLGGDEFAILLPDTDLSGARAFFRGLHESLIHVSTLNDWPIGYSIGVALFDSCEITIEEAIGYADALMYGVKNSGKNNIAFGQYPGSPPVTKKQERETRYAQ